jgi:hypothetical protein
MRRISMLATLAVAALVAMGTLASASLASSTTGGAGGSAGASRAAKTTTKTHYVLSYTDEKWGPVACTGVHIVSLEYPGSATSGGADKFKCISTTGKAVTYGAPGETLINPTEWQSDYFASIGIGGVVTGQLTITISKSGKSYKGFAVYPYTPGT